MALSFKTAKYFAEQILLNKYFAEQILLNKYFCIAKLLLNYFGMETLKELQFAFDTSQISRSTYFRKLKKIREGESLKRRKGSGRPRKIKGKFIQKAVSIALKNPHISAK